MTTQNFTVDNGLTVTGTGGNITGANVVNANSFVGNTPNVEIVAGAQSWLFDNTGNLTMAGNVSMPTGQFDITGNVIAYTVKTTPVIVSSLPEASAVGAGARAFVTNADTAVFGNLVVGGGPYYVPVFSNGTTWYIG